MVRATTTRTAATLRRTRLLRHIAVAEAGSMSSTSFEDDDCFDVVVRVPTNDTDLDTTTTTMLTTRRESSRSRADLEPHEPMPLSTTTATAATDHDPVVGHHHKPSDTRRSCRLHIRHVPLAAMLTVHELEQCLQLFTDNMSDWYRASSWGLDLDAKRREFTHPHARFWLVTTTTARSTGICSPDEHPSSGASSSLSSSLAAMVHYRFELDDDDDPACVVLYLYEIQVAAPYRRAGLGRQLMTRIEQVARSVNRASGCGSSGSGTKVIAKIVLTAFTANHAALHFYKSTLGYKLDESSPGYQNPHEEADYEILSKKL